MAGATRTTADATLQEDYQPLVREQINNDIPLLTYAEKNSKDIEGRRAVLSLHVSRNSGIGARAEAGTLPTRGAQGFAEERVPLYYNYGSGGISGPLLKSADTNRASFIRAIDAETKMIVNDLKRDVNRQIWGTANGVIANTSLTSNSTVINLATTAAPVQVRQIEVGEVIDIGTVASPTAVGAGYTVASVDTTLATPNITIDTTSITTTAAHFIFRTGNGGAIGGVGQKEITGAQYMVDDANTLFNVNPSTYPVWKSVDNGNSGTARSVSEQLMAKTIHDVVVNSGQWPNLGVTSYGVQEAYAALLTTLKRFTNTVNVMGGYGSGISFTAGGGSEIPITVDRDCPKGSMYFFNTSHLIEYQMSDWEFHDQDGSVLHWLGSTDDYQFLLKKYMEFATDERNSHGRLVDLTEAS